jgi:hypothetical protein
MTRGTTCRRISHYPHSSTRIPTLIDVCKSPRKGIVDDEASLDDPVPTSRDGSELEHDGVAR